MDAIFTGIVSDTIIGDYMIRSATHLIALAAVKMTAEEETEGIFTDGATDTRFVNISQSGYYLLLYKE